MPHQHHFNPVEPRAYVTVTQVQSVTITQGSPTPVVAPPTHRAGRPVATSQSPVENSSAPTPTSTPYHAPARHHRPSHTQSTSKSAYHAPPERHHRPTHVQPDPVHRTTGHSKVAETSKKQSHHHVASHSIKKSTSSATHRPASTGTGHSFDQNPGANLQKTTKDSSMSGGAKAGLAIGLILIFALIGVLVFLLYRRKKNHNSSHQPLDDEKSNLNRSNGSISSHVSVRRTVANAPRLSLRPVTDMFPTMSEKQDQNTASTLIANSAASAGNYTAESTSRHAQSTVQVQDPFADNFEDGTENDLNTLAAPNPVAPKPLSIKSERTGNSDQALPNVNQPASASGLAQNNKRLSPPGPGPNNVHRVQLDFNPSMDDELGLRAGQLVRMLHEYDDGWALCIRLDRSQQGVVPRTCISKLPVKPRPQGPPSTRTPAQGRPRGASNGPVARGQPPDPSQRAITPQSGRIRSQSSGPQQAGSQATTDMPLTSVDPSYQGVVDPIQARRMTPPSASASSSASTSPTQTSAVPNRKPVPGQALSC